MKASNYTGPLPHRGSIGATRFSPRQTSITNIDLKGAVNNYLTASPSFTVSNNIIVYLDAYYKTLPSSVTGGWSAAASGMGTAAVCGCPRSNMTGQKLFRVINFPLIQAGLPPTIIPPDTTTWSEISTTDLNQQNFLSNVPPIRKIQIDTNLTAADGVIAYRLYGQTAAVPVLANTIHTIMNEGDDGFDLLWSWPQGRQLPWCSFLASGLPSTAGFSAVFYAEF